ncbi:hypothetical protein [Acinetobacter indicus]|uniref:hypothetical protein n=1 Tax=Acinetobacter indicus TaxID=756892 RepID=UPI000CEB65D7|nr:hypothetical protein [Acinetobacter indicus]AVH14361.1 carboxypeptidase regulatory-like domain-containing protein [Acinetobacter indicus]
MSNIRILRFFSGGYTPNEDRLVELNYIRHNPLKRIMVISGGDRGLGQIKGSIKKLGLEFPKVNVCVFKRSNRQLLWETTSKADGSYAFRNITVGLECFVVAFDPNNQYNAVIQDKVIAK